MSKPPAGGTLAERADRHALYQEAVQDVESEIDFVVDTWAELRARPARHLREDFCGTANTSCEWVHRDDAHHATGVDLDGEVLDWGWTHNVAELDLLQQDRVELVEADVRNAGVAAQDIVLAMNFSYYLFLHRAELAAYFRSVHASLVDDGIFFLDAYGGYESPMVISEDRECDGFTYTWDQASFNPIDGQMDCHIHFSFPDGSRLERAFSYRWRLWTLPEIRELLNEAGFSSVVVYWEGTDEATGEGDGIYMPSDVGDADPGWVCYVVAEK